MPTTLQRAKIMSHILLSSSISSPTLYQVVSSERQANSEKEQRGRRKEGRVKKESEKGVRGKVKGERETEEEIENRMTESKRTFSSFDTTHTSANRQTLATNDPITWGHAIQFFIETRQVVINQNFYYFAEKCSGYVPRDLVHLVQRAIHACACRIIREREGERERERGGGGGGGGGENEEMRGGGGEGERVERESRSEVNIQDFEAAKVDFWPLSMKGIVREERDGERKGLMTEKKGSNKK